MIKKILYFGDVIGKPGRKALLKVVPGLIEKYAPDFIVANVENLAHGKGVTVETLKQIDGLGIDVYTSGNHAFSKKELSAQAFQS